MIITNKLYIHQADKSLNAKTSARHIIYKGCISNNKQINDRALKMA